MAVAAAALSAAEAWDLQGGQAGAIAPTASYDARLERAVIRGTPPRLCRAILSKVVDFEEQSARDSVSAEDPTRRLGGAAGFLE